MMNINERFAKVRNYIVNVFNEKESEMHFYNYVVDIDYNEEKEMYNEWYLLSYERVVNGEVIYDRVAVKFNKEEIEIFLNGLEMDYHI